ncbi:MAG TPA: trehalose-phosphatase [Gammaproteobacteria bacterium]|nr:trehalose-phosphatase [Gammaproteobacteria bacterium]
MALVSGRSVEDIDRIFAPVVFPVAGSHGAELRIDGDEIVTHPHGSLPRDVLARIEGFVAAHEGLLLEYKRGGVSLHYRRAPQLEAECRELVRQVMGGLGDDYRLIAGKMVFEIAPRGYDKGAAIEAFLRIPTFAGQMPVFVGDDVTDEDGFRIVNELGGVSIRVGEIEHSRACFWLSDVAAVRPWLATALLGDAHRQRYGEKRL